jgi:hypothetical protein
MKKLIGAACLILLAYSCKKDAGKKPETNSYLHSVLSHLRDSMSIEDFSQLDPTTAWQTDPGKGKQKILRLAFYRKRVAGDFVLLRTDDEGNILQGQMVHLETDGQLAGNIRLYSLSGHPLLQSKISNGYIEVLHGSNGFGKQLKAPDSRTVTLEPAPPADLLPEVVVIGYTSDSPPSGYISLDGLLDASGALIPGGGGDAGGSEGSTPVGGGGGASSGAGQGARTGPVYSPIDPGEGSGTFSRGAGLVAIPSLELEQEYVNSIPIVDIRKMFNCFDQIPNDGASYSVQLCVDVPVNGNPAASSNTSGINAGHSFLVITKSGTGISITQSFGFYPKSLSILDPFSTVSSAIKNNGGQEINGNLAMSISTEQFNNLKATAIELSTKQYSLDSWNCTDYALSVFNSVRNTPIALDPYIIRQPGISISGAPASPGFNVIIANSPQRLYEKLNTMKKSGAAEASNILLDLSHNLSAPDSHGECN